MSIKVRWHGDRERDFIDECVRRANRIKAELDGVNINIQYEYFIEWKRINSYMKLMAWIDHLSEKVWWEKYDTTTLIRAVQDHFKWPRSVHL